MHHKIKYYISAFMLGLLLAGPIQVLAEDQEILETTEEPAVLEEAPSEQETEPVDQDIIVQEEELEEDNLNAGPGTPSVQYYAHVENIGDQEMKSDGEMAGTEGQSLRMEAVTIYLDSGSYDGGIEYAAHVENIGWQSPVSSGEMAGTAGQALRVEAIKIWLTGNISNYYDVYYRAHIEDYGWLGWAKDGQCSGSAGYGKRMEAFTIKLVKKGGGTPPTYPAEPFVANGISYDAHVANVGWQPYVNEGEMAGTTGQGNAVEAFRIKLENQQYSGSIKYAANVVGEGWLAEVTEDKIAGTVGQSKPIQALKITLTGEMASHYSVFYRVHSSNIGWQGWTSNGNAAGTSNYGQRIEAIEIKLIDKYETKPPVSSDAYLVNDLAYNAHVSNIGWQNTGVDGSLAGTTGMGLPVEAVRIYLENKDYTGDILYRTQIQDIGWESGWKKNGAVSGTTGQAKPIEAIQIKLSGEIANHYDVYYRTHVANYGWMAWASNGTTSGTVGFAYPIEAIEITLSKAKTDNINTITSLQSNVGYINNTKASGWQKINNCNYYFYDDGTLARDTVVSDGVVDSLGRKIEGITVVNGIILVNKKHGLPGNYAPGENPVAGAQIRQLIADMQNLGYFMSNYYSGYRSYETQNNLYWSYVYRDGQAAADWYSARPGYSEHQTGLAFDLTDGYGNLVTSAPEVNWIRANAHKYGFIVRYLAEKEYVTGYMAEPWHLRYIGSKASDIYYSGLTLEEYLGVPGGPNY